MVYPRVCGGTEILDAARSVPAGLSPRVRGNLLDVADWEMENRSIPACAGEPLWIRGSASMTKVYPRVCGGTQASLLRGYNRKGLSPRVRGNPPGLR